MSTKRKAASHPRTADRVHTMKPRTSRPDSERDSGFSDASSEQMGSMDTTDSEDSPHPKVKQGHQSARSVSSGLAVVGGSYSSLSPMIIMNNVLLKQPADNPPAMKPWGLNPTVKVVQQPPFVFIQPVVSRQASSASKEPASRHKRSKKYLPILKSYPKIAPYPRDSSGSGRGAASSSTSTSSGSQRSSGSLNSNQCEASQREKTECGSLSDSATPGLPVAPVSPLTQSRPSLQTTETNSSPRRDRPSSAVRQTEALTTTGSKDPALSRLRPSCVEKDSSSDQCSLSDCDSDSKRKRFCNTYNILSKSGLLDITLRTKELLRQNRRTQSDLDRLKEQTDLFLRALQSGDASVRLQLQASLQEEQERGARVGLKAD